eukprot:3095498-Prymnesium_polylepis.3
MLVRTRARAPPTARMRSAAPCTCGIVDDESLLEEAHLAVKLFEAPLDHLVDNLLRLALAEGLLRHAHALVAQRAQQWTLN